MRIRLIRRTPPSVRQPHAGILENCLGHPGLGRRHMRQGSSHISKPPAKLMTSMTGQKRPRITRKVPQKGIHDRVVGLTDRNSARSYVPGSYGGNLCRLFTHWSREKNHSQLAPNSTEDGRGTSSSWPSRKFMAKPIEGVELGFCDHAFRGGRPAEQARHFPTTTMIECCVGANPPKVITGACGSEGRARARVPSDRLPQITVPDSCKGRTIGTRPPWRPDRWIGNAHDASAR